MTRYDLNSDITHKKCKLIGGGSHVRSNRDTKHVGTRKYLKKKIGGFDVWVRDQLLGFGRREGSGNTWDKTRQDKRPTGRTSEPARAYDRSQTDRMAHTSSRRPPLSVAPPEHFPIQQVLTRDRGCTGHSGIQHFKRPAMLRTTRGRCTVTAEHKMNIKPSVCKHRRRRIPAIRSSCDDNISLWF